MTPSFPAVVVVWEDIISYKGEGAAMIYSDKQYGISSAQLAKLRDALSAAKDRTSDQPWLKKAEIDGLKSQIADIEAELAEYNMLKSDQGLYGHDTVIPKGVVRQIIFLDEDLDVDPEATLQYATELEETLA